MIRAFAIGLCLATAAQAQTPVDISVANVLRTCVQDANGTRDAARIAQLEKSLARVPDRRWTNVTEIAPGVHRITDSRAQIIIEIKLPDAAGAAHCMAFGPMLTAGQAALSADKFVEFNFLDGLAPATPQQGMARRYVMIGAPYTAELVALQSTQHGEVVGFLFSGVPQDLTTRTLASAGSGASEQAVSRAMSNAINICLRNYFQRDTVDASLPAGGFELGYTDGRDTDLRTYFSPDNTVSLRIGPGQCSIETKLVSTPATVQIVQTALNASAPGMFDLRQSSFNGCPAFYANRSLNMPLGINVLNRSGPVGQRSCSQDGTSRIDFVVAG